MACLFQFQADFLSIVQLSIIDQRVFFRAVFQRHGLLAALGVDDGKSGMQQGTALRLEKALPIGAPSGHRSQHFSDDRLRNRQIDTACNGTHWITTSFRLIII